MSQREYQEWYAKQREQLKQRGYCVCAAAKVVAVGAKREEKGIDLREI